jgi:CHAD domain-containing protein
VTVVEREIKLAAPPAVVLPPLSDPLAGVVAEPAGTRYLLATYYDTADLRLARAGASLRHRNDEGWAVKLPVGERQGRLDRDTFAFEGDDTEPPAAAVDLLRALIRAAPVTAVARLRTTRRAVRLRTTQGIPIGEVVDDDVTVLGGDAPVRTFRELEFELVDDAPEAQAASIVARLRAAGAGPPDPTPKIVRALGPRATDPPDVGVAAGAAHTLADVVQAALAGPVARLIAHDPGVRQGGDDEDVHQARVATRRLRSHLRAFAPLLDEPWATALREELGWLGGVLGGVRDADVLLDRLDARAAGLPRDDLAGAMRLLDRLRTQRGRAHDELLVAIRSPRYTALLDRLVDAVREPRVRKQIVDEPEDEVLRNVVRRTWKHLRDAVDALPEPADDDALHAVRRRAKRARYAAEAVEPAFGKSARAFARAITELQDVLGEHQDAVVTGAWLRDTAANSRDERAAFAAGELAAEEREAARVGRDAWPAAWQSASRKQLRTWL